jgi:hypothetical protein
VYTLQFTTVHFTVFPLPSLFLAGPRTSCGPNYQLTLYRLVSELYNLGTDRRENNSSHYCLSSRYQVTSFTALEQTYSVLVTIWLKNTVVFTSFNIQSWGTEDVLIFLNLVHSCDPSFVCVSPSGQIYFYTWVNIVWNLTDWYLLSLTVTFLLLAEIIMYPFHVATAVCTTLLTVILMQ